VYGCSVAVLQNQSSILSDNIYAVFSKGACVVGGGIARANHISACVKRCGEVLKPENEEIAKRLKSDGRRTRPNELHSAIESRNDD